MSTGPDTPQPPTGNKRVPPFILDQRPDGDAGVLVTWSLPGLRRVTVRVPADSWIQGYHLALPPALVTLTTPPVVPVSDDQLAPDDDEQPE